MERRGAGAVHQAPGKAREAGKQKNPHQHALGAQGPLEVVGAAMQGQLHGYLAQTSAVEAPQALALLELGEYRFHHSAAPLVEGARGGLLQHLLHGLLVLVALEALEFAATLGPGALLAKRAPGARCRAVLTVATPCPWCCRRPAVRRAPAGHL